MIPTVILLIILFALLINICTNTDWKQENEDLITIWKWLFKSKILK